TEEIAQRAAEVGLLGQDRGRDGPAALIGADDRLDVGRVMERSRRGRAALELRDHADARRGERRVKSSRLPRWTRLAARLLKGALDALVRAGLPRFGDDAIEHGAGSAHRAASLGARRRLAST